MSNRTTFFIVEVAGPYVPLTACDAVPAGSQAWADLARLAQRTNTLKVLCRHGAWQRASIERLAQRGGAVLKSAYSIARDSKGYIESSRKPI